MAKAGEKGKNFSVSEIAGELKIPQPFLRKILQTLNKKNLLRSCKGAGGGFRLSRLPDKIFLVELIEIFQGKMKIIECFLRKKICPNKRDCRLKKKLEEIEKYVVSELSSITIKDLLE